MGFFYNLDQKFYKKQISKLLEYFNKAFQLKGEKLIETAMDKLGVYKGNWTDHELQWHWLFCKMSYAKQNKYNILEYRNNVITAGFSHVHCYFRDLVNYIEKYDISVNEKESLMHEFGLIEFIDCCLQIKDFFYKDEFLDYKNRLTN